MTIPFSSITEGTRARKAEAYGDIDGLAKSIKALGTIQPIVLSKQVSDCDHAEIDNETCILCGECRNSNSDNYGLGPNTKFLLVAGGRRFRALQKLGITVLHHGSTLNPSAPGFLFADEVPEHIRKEAELDENLRRLDMTWIDSVLLVAETHEAKKRAGGKSWGREQTAALLGTGYNETKVTYALQIADFLRSGDKEMLAAPNMSGAMKVLCKKKEDEALAEKQKRAVKSMPKGGDVLSPLNPSEILSDMRNSKSGSNGPEESNPLPGPLIPLSALFRLGDFRNLNWPQVDHIVTDIPYGIDMDNLDAENVASTSSEHDELANVQLMPEFLARSYQTIKPGGFLVFFYDLEHHNFLQTWSENVGFKTQNWPFIACKTSTCRNQAAQFNTTKNYEVAMFCRKDGGAVLRKPVPSSWSPYDFNVERSDYSHPFAKPRALWLDIYRMISFPGQSVLDPFAGEWSAGRAAIEFGLVPHGIELIENHFNRGMEHARKEYLKIHADARFT